MKLIYLSIVILFSFNLLSFSFFNLFSSPPDKISKIAKAYGLTKEQVTKIEAWNKSKRDTFYALMEMEKNRYWTSLKSWCLSFDSKLDHCEPVKFEPEKSVEYGEVVEDPIAGYGGSKKAFQLENGLVMMLPNTDVDSLSYIASWWEYCVNDEVNMAMFLENIGILALNRKKAMLVKPNCSLPDEPCRLPVIISDSFDAYAKRGWFIFDVKNNHSSTWGKSKYNNVSNDFKVFSNDQDPFDFKVWEPIIKPFIEDMIKLAHHEIKIGSDNSNYVAIRNPKQKSPWTLRYFGFDFSGKYGGQSIPSPKDDKILSSRKLSKICPKIKTLVGWTVGAFAETVFNITRHTKEQKQKEVAFVSQLEKHFSDCGYIVSSFSHDNELEDL